MSPWKIFVVDKFQSIQNFWGEDLTAYEGMEETVAEWLTLIKADAKAALQTVIIRHMFQVEHQDMKAESIEVFEM